MWPARPACPDSGYTACCTGNEILPHTGLFLVYEEIWVRGHAGINPRGTIVDVHVRFIPAYAGNTPPTHPATSPTTAHPAYAGNTSSQAHPGPLRRAHPRIRGEHLLMTWENPRPAGSPPHTRGTPPQRPERQDERGLTPAYAGNTLTMLKVPVCITAHPRIRGEHFFRVCSHSSYSGSPPHTRGTHGLGRPLRWAGGLTPAYAGNTRGWALVVAGTWAHPRIRGEHAVPFEDASLGFGSPPHTRGTPKVPIQETPGFGLTPAYAGNTLPDQQK